jgi:hypothetical protein
MEYMMHIIHARRLHNALRTQYDALLVAYREVQGTFAFNANMGTGYEIATDASEAIELELMTLLDKVEDQLRDVEAFILSYPVTEEMVGA